MDFDASRPIWLQIVEEFRRRIAVGLWRPGGRIPSVRDLALELGVNPNTVQRALTELDRLGLTASERTAGRYVLGDQEAADSTASEIATQLTDTYIAQIRGLGYGLDEAVERLRTRWGTTKGD